MGWKLMLGLLLAFIALIGITSWAPDVSLSELSKQYAKPPSQFAEINGQRLHLRDEGPKEDDLPIVLLHGTSASLHTWDGWATELQSSRRVVRFDLPGFGLTGPSVDADYSIEYYAATVVGVLDALGIERCILVGNSLGGYVAWVAGLQYPERVEKLVLVDSAGIPFESASVPLGFKLAQIESLRWVTERFLPRALIAASVRNVYADSTRVTDQIIDRYYDLTRRAGNRRALIARFQQTQPSALAERLGELTQPTLILWGDHDRLIPLSVAEVFSKTIPDSQLIVLPNVGHVPQEEVPAQSLRAVRAFLD
ncbi:alpha/beta fold hydrolase [Simiduia aestuariiviva]|uniref:Pimeloyl-ACP methyl ester carboxylesterase n=1 Tax=Simiduia aestuariiviva TaxID=1510459 RepID=A0A839URX6_9GAMM|nr:alpha/beta hydrolase [Simiduia aestuariiviva]MBB3169219.1 pimeloyl-ACP methyl ester carboxylesterase [Simiduia aestuariiviva]